MSAVGTHLGKAGEYMKALVAAVGGLIITVQVVADVNVLPAEWTTAALAALTTASVWLVKNTDRVDRAGDTAGEFVNNR